MATSPIHGLPPELLQKVWSFLPVFDLLRCQRVCKGWNTFLPGDDQALHRAMFSPATLATSPGTSSWDVCIDFRQHHRVQLRALPRLVFSLDVTTSTLSREEPMRQTPTGEWVVDETHYDYHHILKDTHAFVDLIHPEFPGKNQSFKFTDIQDLKLLEKEPESNNAPWQKMLACVPAVKILRMSIFWRLSISDHGFEGFEWYHVLQNDNGVTVGDFVQHVRQELKDAETQLTNFAGGLKSIENYNCTAEG